MNNVSFTSLRATLKTSLHAPVKLLPLTSRANIIRETLNRILGEVPKEQKTQENVYIKPITVLKLSITFNESIKSS